MKKLLFFLTIITIGCNVNKTDLISDINIDVNEKAIYSNDSSQIVDFIIFPTEPNSIWVINRNGPGYNLNVKDSSWSLLDSRFGKYSSGIKNRYFFKDPVNSDLLWLGNFHGGLRIFNQSTDSFTKFPHIKPVSSILFLKKFVLVGTWRGFYKIDRKTLISTKISQISEIQIDNLEALNDNEVLVNYKYCYNITTDNLERLDPPSKEICDKKEGPNYKLVFFKDNTLKLSIGDLEEEIKFYCMFKNNILIDENNIWIPSRNLKDGILKYTFSNSTKANIDIGYDFYNSDIVNDKDFIWFYKKSTILCFNKLDYTAKIIQLDTDIHNMTVDSKNLYFNTWKTIQIWSKDYLLSESYSTKQANDEENKFQNLVDSLDIYHSDDFDDYYNSYKLIQKRFEASTNARILKKIGYLKGPIASKLIYSNRDIKKIEKIIHDNIKEDDIKASAYLQLAEMANHKGNLKQSLYFDSILVKQYPEYRTDNYQYRIEKVREYDKKIDSLITENLPKDELLWETGNAYFELFKYVGPSTEASTTNMSYPFQFYNELLEKYPDSKYADNAAIRMFSHLEGGSHEGGDNSYNLTAIDEYKKLLKKYPDTELKPFVYHTISRLYFECEMSFSEKPKYYKFAREYAELTLNNYPNYSEVESVTYLLQEIDKNLSHSLWEFIIESDKAGYTISEPINITFSLKNIDSTPKTIRIPVDNNIPHFLLNIYRYSIDKNVGGHDIMEIEPNIAEYNKEFRDTIIGINQTYVEKWNIKRNARKDLGKGPGSFNISEEGRYLIRASCQGSYYAMFIPSDPIWITVKKD